MTPLQALAELVAALDRKDTDLATWLCDLAFLREKARAVLAQPEGLDAMALQMLVAAGHVTQGKVDEAFAILRMAESAPKETT